MDVDSDSGCPSQSHTPLNSSTGNAGSEGQHRRRSEEKALHRGASASQQLTQLAQMVQEHYPYKPSDLKGHQHTG